MKTKNKSKKDSKWEMIVANVPPDFKADFLEICKKEHCSQAHMIRKMIRFFKAYHTEIVEFRMKDMD